eukprot:12551041-Alexandrium_andersonii.AAC.1
MAGGTAGRRHKQNHDRAHDLQDERHAPHAHAHKRARANMRTRVLKCGKPADSHRLSLIHISEPTRLALI